MLKSNSNSEQELLDLCSLVCIAFARVCEQSTDFHFTDLEHQLEETEESVQMANDDRAPKMRGGSEDLDRLSLRSSGSGASEVVMSIL